VPTLMGKSASVAILRRSMVTGLSSRGLNQSMVIHCCAISSIAIVVLLFALTMHR
jgi:hypothetical protein